MLAVLVLSIALNIVLIRSQFRGMPHDAWFVYPPADSFDQASDVNQAIGVGGVAAFVGKGELAPAWVPCAGQTLERADYPDLFALLERTHMLEAMQNERSAASPGTFTLPDLRGLVFSDVRAMLRDARPDGLATRFLRWALTARGVTQMGATLVPPSSVPSGADGRADWADLCVFAVRAR